MAEINRNLTRHTGWEAVMRIRVSRGVRISSFHGHFFVRSSDLLSLPQVRPATDILRHHHIDVHIQLAALM